MVRCYISTGRRRYWGFHHSVATKDMVKESRNRPGVAQRVPGGLGSQIPWHSTREGGKVSLMHRPPLLPGTFLVLIFIRGWVDPRAMEWSEENMSLKNPVRPPGIDPGTIWLVAQCLNHYATPGPHKHLILEDIKIPKVLLGYSHCFYNVET